MFFGLIHTNKVAHFSKDRKEESTYFREQLTLSEPIFKTKYSENKKHNINLATQRIANISIRENEIFSFWELIGKPSEKKGYKVARIFTETGMVYEPGGGLCQLATILYFLAIKSGLEIVQRFSHTHDFYTYEPRYTPLGSDAAVSYNNKDLQIKNNLGFPFCFRVEIVDDYLFASICSREKITNYQIEFEETKMQNMKIVKTLRSIDNKVFEQINVASYTDFMKK